MGGTLGNLALAKWMILAVFLSAAGSTLSCIVAAARITFAMGHDHVFPPILSRTDHKYRTPSVATVVAVLVTGGALWLYSLGSASVQGTFNSTISTAGLLFTLFYVVTGIAMPIYYRKLATTSAKNFVELAVVPVLSTVFLLWIGWKSIGTSLGGWTGEDMKYLYVMLLIGAGVLVYARLRHRAAYWGIRPTAFDPTTDVADYTGDGTEGAPVTTP
jgi:amino acid transporter